MVLTLNKKKTLDLTAVPEGHHEFIDGLQGALAHLEAELAERPPLAAYRGRLQDARRSVQTALRAFAEGYDLTTPPQYWYSGRVLEGQRLDGDWPTGQYGNSADVVYYNGYMPVKIQKKYLEARRLFGNSSIAVYSPRDTDFTIIRRWPHGGLNRLIDPLLIAQVRDIPDLNRLFFLVAQWNMARDLELNLPALETPIH